MFTLDRSGLRLLRTSSATNLPTIGAHALLPSFPAATSASNPTGAAPPATASICFAPPASGAPSAKAMAAARWRLSAASSAPTAWFPFSRASAPTITTVACPAHPPKPTPPAAVSASSPRFLCRTRMKTSSQQKARSRFNEPAPASSLHRGGRSFSRSELLC
jgi:hypothetical protein